MRYFTDIREEDAVSVITLKDESSNCEAEVYTFGALLNAFSLARNNDRINVIDGFTSSAEAKQNITKGFKSAKLSPFVCRMNEGRYSFANTKHKIDKFYLGDSAIHGLLFDAPFTIKSSGADNEKAFITLICHYDNKSQGFPYPFIIEVTYLLHDDKKLSLTTTVINTGPNDMPLSDGWHPYFTLGNSVNDLQLQFKSKEIVEFNDQLIPSGKLLPYANFNSFKTLGDTFLDNCFTLSEEREVSCSLKNESIGLQVNIIPDASYPYLQIYTPPHRKSIAIENLSSPPDSFNNDIGLIVAKPGQQFTFVTSYQIVIL